MIKLSNTNHQFTLYFRCVTGSIYENLTSAAFVTILWCSETSRLFTEIIWIVYIVTVHMTIGHTGTWLGLCNKSKRFRQFAKQCLMIVACLTENVIVF